MAAIMRHRIFYAVLRALACPFVRLKLNYRYERAEGLKPPFIVLANHNLDLDPALVGMGFKEHMYFVASEHIFRFGLFSKLVSYLVAPISRLKGSTDAGVVREIFRRLHAGASVCVFAEGNRSWTGVTGEILDSTGKMVKSSRAPLVTFRIEGGYLASPRWGKKLRRGLVRGRVVGVYGADQLKAMSASEVNAAINADLYEDAFERQRETDIPFRGKDIAENLELALAVCPSCGAIGKLHSKGDRFYCDCGFSCTYNEKGFFEGAPFETVREWDAFDQGRLHDLFTGLAPGALAFSDAGEHVLRHIKRAHRFAVVAKGPMAMYRDRLTIGDHSFSLSEITDLSITLRCRMMFSTLDGAHYEIMPRPRINARKYLSLYRFYRAEEGERSAPQ